MMKRRSILNTALCLLGMFHAANGGTSYTAVVDVDNSRRIRGDSGRNILAMQQQDGRYNNADAANGSASSEGCQDSDSEQQCLGARHHQTVASAAASFNRILESASIPEAATPPGPTKQHADRQISAVLVVNLKDAHLAALLMTTLRECGAMDVFREFFVVVPGGELAQIDAILRNSTRSAPFGAKGADRAEMVLVDEKELLSSMGLDKVEPWWQPYSLQMILKLLASSLMKTPFYITLDADVLCTKDGLLEDDLLEHGKGTYAPEERAIHSKWWSDAALTLGVEGNPLGEGFGVTPAVLSTSGVGFVFELLKAEYGETGFLSRILDGWLTGPGGWWSEYTLYRTALDHVDAFHTLHAVGPTKLISEESVWYAEQFDAWNVTATFDDGTAAFAVVQSTANIGVSGILGKIREGLDEERRCEKHPASPGSPPPSLRRRIAINHMEVLSA